MPSQAWIDVLHTVHQAKDQPLLIDHVKDVHGDLPGPYEKPDHFDLNDAPSDEDMLHLALPARIERFQQGALALQWDALPYFYEHRLLLVAYSSHQVSPITKLDQRDFEYQSPAPKVVAQGVETTGVNATARTFTLHLNNFWACLPPAVQASWPAESPDGAQAGARRLSSLPDPEVVYQLVEEFSGNIEVQLEIAADPKTGEYVFRRLGRKYAPVESSVLHLPSDSTAPYELTFTLKAVDATKPEPAAHTVQVSTLDLVPNGLPQSLQGKVEIDREEKMIRCLGYLSLADAQTIYGWFADSADKEAIRRLFELSVRTGARGRELKLRTRRGSASPVMARFDVPALPGV